MNKYEKIVLVNKLGLNTEENILISSLLKEDIEIINKFTENLNRVSIRSFSYTNSKIKSPHYPIVKKADIISTIKTLLDLEFNAIVAKPIDPEDALLAGAIGKINNIYYIELANGPCTTRKVTHDGIIDHRKVIPPDVIADNRIKDMMVEVEKIPFSNFVAEVSYYKIPVGIKNEHVIIWGIEDDGSGKSINEIEDFSIRKNNWLRKI